MTFHVVGSGYKSGFAWHKAREQALAKPLHQPVIIRNSPVNFARKAGLFSFVALALALSACQKTESPAAPTEAAETSGPDAKPGLAADGGRLVMPVVAGRPAAAYFTLRNNGPEPVTLAAAHIDGVGKAELHETTGGKMASMDAVEVGAGEAVAFAPGGKHVMAFDLADTLTPGGTTEMTLTFADGDKVSFPLAIETMGAGSAHP